MFSYNLTSKPKFNTNKKTIDYIFEIISKTVVKEQKGILNIVFLDAYSIKNLNKNYRNIDKTTDVLSFHYFGNFKNLKEEEIAGEIIMSEEKIISQGLEFGLGEENEFYKLLIHSILHILGYDHEIDEEYIIMQKLEEKIYKEVFEK